ncbi:hypothetical protein T03_10302 [Trichinella britovi]|uniref:Uncharacterized protein n=1 Tax=Trichinella britovi TaxID=45882 RepID=A0A0V1C3A8_TRIBR|nr:hypothetical protein T03_10302 [Trichinella britovi]
MNSWSFSRCIQSAISLADRKKKLKISNQKQRP